MTTISEAEEFLGRLKNGGPFPMFTSCCPAWVKYLELNNPHYLKNISSCKSPNGRCSPPSSATATPRRTRPTGARPIRLPSCPGTAKKMEAARDEFIHDGRPDVDLVLTTRELVDMIREAGICFSELEPESPDLPFGLGSGAAVIYGVTGGVAEAVVRYCLPDKSKNALRAVSVTNLRGTDGIREVVLPPRGAGAAHRDCQRTCQRARAAPPHDAGEVSYHLIEVMSARAARRRRGSAPTA